MLNLIFFKFGRLYLPCSIFDITTSWYNTPTDWFPSDFIYIIDQSLPFLSVCAFEVGLKQLKAIGSAYSVALKCAKTVLSAPQITLNLRKSCNTTPDGLILFNPRKSCSCKNFKVSCSADNIVIIIRRIWDACYVGGLPKRLIAFFSAGSRVCLPNPAGMTVTQGKTGISDSTTFD